MKALPLLLAALCIAPAGCVHTAIDQGAATAPVGSDMAEPASAHVTTDTRQMDERSNWTAKEERSATEIDNSNWRTSDGFNSDPDNPSGAPGPSSELGTGYNW